MFVSTFIENEHAVGDSLAAYYIYKSRQGGRASRIIAVKRGRQRQIEATFRFLGYGSDTFDAI